MPIPERPDWKEIADRDGFRYTHSDGERYWDESACFAFTLDQVERDLEAPTVELHDMCLDLVDRASRDETLMRRLGVPEAYHDLVASSWDARHATVTGRMDLTYDGTGPAKLLEYNADTPTGSFEAGAFQWGWLDGCIAAGTVPTDADQFNLVHDRLVETYRELGDGSLLHFMCDMRSVEDFGNTAYLMECASQGGLRPKFVDIALVGADAQGRFVDQDDLVIDRLSNLHPWEWLFAETYGPLVAGSGTTFFEPPWKAAISTKAILPVLWELHEDHPNLLPSWFEGDPRAASLGDHVRKPLFSREGANTTLVQGGRRTLDTGGPYGEEGYVVQAAHPLFASSHGYAVVGSWVVGNRPAGLGIREDSTPVTRNLSRFVPHLIADVAWAPDGTETVGRR